MSGLPKGWVDTTISDITDYVQRGKGPKYAEKNSFPVVNQKAVRWYGLQEEHLKYVREDTWDKYTPERFIQVGDILWNSTGTGTIGRACLLNEAEANKAKVVDSHVTILRPNAHVEPRYLFAWIRSPKVQHGIASLSNGTTNQVELSKSRVLETEIPLAPLNEQIRIANKLDSILAKVDKAQDRLDKIPAILKRFRQSVLAAATSGELTDSSVTSKEWKSVKLIDVVETKPRNGKSPKGVDFDTGIKNLTLSAITPGYFVENKFKFVDLDVSSDSHLWVKNQDILIQRANSIEYVGVSALYEGEDDQYIYPDLIMKCRANERILSKYLYYALSSEPVRKYFRDNATGTTGNMPKINQAVVSAAPISLPPLVEQEDIVRLVEKLFRKADTVEKQYLDAKARLDRLTQSILAKAFRGELVPQDPNDEPAEKLFERIVAEKEHSKSKKTTRKRTTKAKTVEKE